LENNIKSKSEEAIIIELAWKKEKEIITGIKNSREKIDKFKSEAIIYERE